MAGASEVLVGSSARWALVHELRGAAEPSLPTLIQKLSPVDLVLVEGYKRERHPNLEIFSAALCKPPLYLYDPAIVAISSDEPLPHAYIAVIQREDVDTLAA